MEPKEYIWGCFEVNSRLTNKCKECNNASFTLWVFCFEERTTKHLPIAIQEKYNLLLNFKYSDCKCILPSYNHTKSKVVVEKNGEELKIPVSRFSFTPNYQTEFFFGVQDTATLSKWLTSTTLLCLNEKTELNVNVFLKYLIFGEELFLVFFYIFFFRYVGQLSIKY